ncbi:MAG: CotH kinase family protein [Candidatus Acidiferrum sp.]
MAQNINLAPRSLTIHPGDVNVPVTVSVSGGAYTGPLNIALIGLPSGITITPQTPLTLAAGQSGTLRLSASLSADQEAFPAAGAADPNSDTKVVTVVGMAGPVLLSSTMNLTVSLSNSSYSPDPSKINLPIVNIDTNGAAIADKTTEVPGTITITSADGQTSYLPNGSDSDNTATFHLHGNSTSAMPKKPYHVKLNTSLDLLNTMGLTCPYVTSSGKKVCDKSKSFILLANYDDKTLLRDWAASALANAIPIGNGYLNSPADSPSPSGTSTLMPWAPHSLFVELYLNGAYEGNYQLTEEVKVDSHRVNINDMAETDTSGNALTGGYLMEIDQPQGEAYNFVTPGHVFIGLVDPDFTPDPEVPQQTSYITNYVDTAEAALLSSSFTDPQQGWRAYFDEASAVNFYIVNDVMGNNDGGAFFSSDYLYKDKKNALLYMGPVWDFDISSGNVNYNPIVNPTVPWMQVHASWYVRWLQDQGFKADLTAQWNALKNNGVFDQWIASINQEAATLQQSQANNFSRWPMQGIKVWPNPEAAGSYSAEVAYLTNWLNLRIAYLDSVFNGKGQTSTTLSIPTGPLRNGSPAILSAQVTGANTLSGTVSFMSGGVLLGTGTLDGTGTASLTTANLPAGNDALQAVYNGNTSQGLSTSPASTVTVLGPLLNTVTSLNSLAASAGAGHSVVFTVSVLGNSGTTTPTGTITFVANGTTLGSISYPNAASFATKNLPGGNVSIQAVYSGDGTYQGSSSNTAHLTILN